MSKKVSITLKQVDQFNRMCHYLKVICQYQSTEKLRKSSGGDYGLDYEEALEYAYENIKNAASIAVKGIKPIDLKPIAAIPKT